jgi:predicted TIM-barrel fold metal-dependent hydrolase
MKSSWKRSCSPPLPDNPGRVGLRASGVVDAHVHVFPPEMVGGREELLNRDARFEALYRSREARMVTAEEVVRHMDEVGVGVSIVFGFAFKDPGLCRLVNDYVIEAVRSRPDRLAGLACVAQGDPGAGAELERCLNAGLSGCGELAPDPTDPHVLSGLAPVAGLLRERSLPLVIHASEPVGHDYPGKGRFSPELCLALAEAYPGLKVVLSHMGGGLFLYELMPEVREALVDVYYDTAAVPYLYQPRVYEVAVACAGANKLIFGSDFPLMSPSRCLAGLESLAPDQRAAAEGGNARGVFDL